MNTPFVQKLFVGKVKKVGNPNATKSMEKEWESGMFKEGTKEKVWLSTTGLVGDEVADKKNHGGPEKALFTYTVDHYDYWQNKQEIEAMHAGGFGENLAVKFMEESSVCIGDTYQLGEAVIQVSQPRRPCWKPARRFKTMDLALRIQDSGRTGWYFRVLKEGYIQKDLEFTLIERPYPEWTIANCNEVMYVKKDDLELNENLASCHLLAENWKQTLMKRLAGKESTGENRVFGPNKQ
ncbi:MOSC domain-containing protein [Ornithinibacillus halotolerans]|uniref:MOSC domain-containing protein n=1 Tax=Ornithinibacillus halotolerans TaxID=1274357 RepID=A0A916W7M1_9BACI|nr:MOSC domain-containing protein [Ornithinibacillus halotolerans]GGA74463.1 MOSC domain-containing protein [Ornithinibacillus halotolerans]